MVTKTAEPKSERLTIELSQETRLAVLTLRAAEVGETIKYATLSEAVGKDIRQHRHILYSAMRILLRERIVFGCVEGTGMRRLNDTEKVGTLDDRLARMRRSTRLGMKVLTSVDYNGLPATTRIRHNAGLSVLGAIGLMAKPDSMVLIEGAVKEKNRELAARNTLALFAKE